MKKEKMFYTICCALGSGLIGFFAQELNSGFGALMFTLGVSLLVFSIFNMSKKENVDK